MSESTPEATANLTDEERARFESQLQERPFADGEALLKEGEPAAGLFLLLEGRVNVHKRDMGGNNQLLTELGAPCILGELELLTSEPCNATVSARGPVRASLLPSATFETMLDARDTAAIKLMRNLARALGKKLSTSNEVYVDLAIWRRGS